jgi:hypothetical protein
MFVSYYYCYYYGMMVPKFVERVVWLNIAGGWGGILLKGFEKKLRFV